jgi:hypothetical protein
MADSVCGASGGDEEEEEEGRRGSIASKRE